MDEYKILIGYLSIIVAVFSYVPYFRGILTGKVKPHAFSWLVWSFLVGIAFAAQVVKEGGAGTWATGFTALACFVIFLFAIVKGDRRFVLFDWISLAAAFVALILWQLTNDPTLSLILVVTTDAFGFLPTLRKGYLKPHEDSPSLWALTATKWGLAIVALGSYSFITLLYPAYLLTLASSYTALLLWRRR
jgi:hypothetical protein